MVVGRSYVDCADSLVYIYLMKTTTKRGATVEVAVVRYELGDEWSRFETKDGGATWLFTTSRDVRIPEMRRELAETQMAALDAGRWERSESGATLPAWAA